MALDSLSEQYYLKIGKASDLKIFKERLIYRLLEILPGFLSWLTLFLILFFSWKEPVWVSVFVIMFVIYWLFRTIYLSFHLWSGYKRMIIHEKENWIQRLKDFKAQDWRGIYHLVVLPFYYEPLDIIRESLKALSNSDYPKDRMIVVLAGEERAGEGGKMVARILESEFKDVFFKFLVTWHPVNLKGEIIGKGANESWATRRVKELIIDQLNIDYKNIIVSSLDADTVVFSGYLSCLTYHYLTAKKPDRTSFQPIPLFINNIWQAPFLSRIFAFSSTFWHIMTQERPEKMITFSSHSMSFKALVDVDFRQVNVVSDDSRIFWQCFLRYDGDYQVLPLYYPISMDANVSVNLKQTIINLYKQQRRWAYGVADIPYFLFGFLKNKKIPLNKKFSLSMELIEGHWSWATASMMIFLLGWMPIILGGPSFSQSLLSFSVPKITSQILTIGMIGLVVSAYFSLILLPPKPPKYGRFKYVFFAVGWLLVPVIMVFFTSIPAFEAQTRLMVGKYLSFWPTEKIRKKKY